MAPPQSFLLETLLVGFVPSVTAVRQSQRQKPAAPAQRRRPPASHIRRRIQSSDGFAVSLSLRNCPEIEDILSRILLGWRLETEASNQPAEIGVARVGRAYCVSAPWLAQAVCETSAVGSVCNLIIELVHAYLVANPSMLCLHCGAAAFGGKAVIFPSTHRAGKSALMACLAYRGHRVIADDVMPVAEAAGHCVALGIAPRPRFPLPEGASDGFREYVRSHAGPGDGYYQYVPLPPERLAPQGTHVPIGAIVLLERDAGASAAFEPVPRSEALQALIMQNFARRQPASAILSRLHKLLRGVPIVRLRYGDIEAAGMALSDAFGAWPTTLPLSASGPSTNVAPAQGPAKSRARTARPKFAGTARFHRKVGIKARSVEGETFLADPDSNAIFRLNALGASIWSLLREPISLKEAEDTICFAFPDHPRAAIAADVANLFGDLARAGLIDMQRGNTQRRKSQVRKS